MNLVKPVSCPACGSVQHAVERFCAADCVRLTNGKFADMTTHGNEAVLPHLHVGCTCGFSWLSPVENARLLKEAW